MPDDAGVRDRSLRPVDVAVLDGDLLGRMVAGRQAGNELRDAAAIGIDLQHAGRILWPERATDSLARVGDEQAAALELTLEGDADRRRVEIRRLLSVSDRRRATKGAHHLSILV